MTAVTSPSTKLSLAGAVVVAEAVVSAAAGAVVKEVDTAAAVVMEAEAAVTVVVVAVTVVMAVTVGPVTHAVAVVMETGIRLECFNIAPEFMELNSLFGSLLPSFLTC